MKNSIRKIIFCVLVLLLSLPATMQLSRLTSFAQTTRNAGFTRQFLRMSSTSDMVYVVSAASRGIGLEFATQLLKQTDSKVVGITRSMSEENKSMHQLKDSFGDRFTMVHADLMDQKSIDLAGKKIADDFGRVDVLLNVAGILGKGVEGEGPERSIAAIDRTWFQKSLETNLMGHVMMTQALFPLLKCSKANGREISKVISVSARVGSISDNKLGGWYSYRMSKAALNMFTKTFSLEAKREKCAVISIHPGTTATDLSKLFQKNVAEGKLFTTEYSVNEMLNNVIWKLQLKDTGKFFAYDGQEIPY